ncbi:uncharacterized protein [Onthophagus taurus]|uniref:uncharacterized protein n=1 Tax=Onthophagus taurus TaxID=166361 RepID=UPI000C20441E|nr:uncharacterized protein LOC111428594 [Onthophagus taurus]
MASSWFNFVFWSFVVSVGVVLAQYDWHVKDAYDEIKYKYDKVTKDNCEIVNDRELFLPEDVISHKPDIKEYNINPVFPNRTALFYLHNMALSRSFFWSYILQSRFIRPARNDTYDPGMMYYLLSTVADVSSNPHVNASSVYFSPNMSYSPSFLGFFNKTFARFAPRSFRLDDFNDPLHLERISTLNTFIVQDLGAVKPDTSSDYASIFYRLKNWYKTWLPDKVDGRHDTKTTYQVKIRYANNTNETFTFHGPPGADETPGPIKWTEPYFDCGRSNRWLVSAVAPIADIFPRHTGFRHVEYPTYTAISVLEMDLERIDINQCPKSLGNDGPNKFANTARCKKETTECEPLDGWGFRRGGYQCRCRPGHRLPYHSRSYFLGEIIERASSEVYYSSFDCKPIGWLHKPPAQWYPAPPLIREYYLNKYHEYKNFTTGLNAMHMKKLNINEALRFIGTMNKENCRSYKKEELILNGNIHYGAKQFFQNEARMAVRLANFISAFLQVSDPKEVFSDKRVPDKPLTEDQMMGETLALIMGNSRIWSTGTYWERNKFTNRTYFAPYAYKMELNTRKYYLEDLARLNKTDELYTNTDWFKFLKQRWQSNFDALEKYNMKIKLRFNETGLNYRKFEHYPNYYRAANLDHGYWSSPYYDCHGKLPMWKIKYASPFFGWDSAKAKLEFKGAVAITVDLLKLDINQCPDIYYEENAFKNTDKCDRKNSYCVPILGRGFSSGGYKCECRQGYEFPYEQDVTYFDGQLVEGEFENLVANKDTRYDLFKCRIAGASIVQINYVTMFVTLLIVMLFYRFR